MAPGSLNRDGSVPLTQQRRTGSAEKRSCSGDGRGCFLCLGSTSKGRRCFRRQVHTLPEKMLTNLPKQKHANHAEGVQYAINSFVCGRYGLQACGANPATSAKSRKRGFQCTTSSASRLSTTLLRLSLSSLLPNASQIRKRVQVTANEPGGIRTDRKVQVRGSRPAQRHHE